MSCGTTTSIWFHHPLFISSYEPLCVCVRLQFSDSDKNVSRIEYSNFQCVRCTNVHFSCTVHIILSKMTQILLFVSVFSLISEEPTPQTFPIKEMETKIKKNRMRKQKDKLQREGNCRWGMSEFQSSRSVTLLIIQKR